METEICFEILTITHNVFAELWKGRIGRIPRDYWLSSGTDLAVTRQGFLVALDLIPSIASRTTVILATTWKDHSP